MEANTFTSYELLPLGQFETDETIKEDSLCPEFTTYA